MDPSRPSDDAVKSIGAGLSKLGLLMRHHSWKEASANGLTPTQGQILAFLQSHPEHFATVGQIAERLAVTPATASDAIQALVTKGLVSKFRSAADARVVEIRLTEAGAARAHTAMAWPDFLIPALGALTPAEQGDFLRSLVIMIRELQETGQVPVSRMCTSCYFFRPNQYPGSARPHHCTFVDAPFGDRELRLDCTDHQQAAPTQVAVNWRRFRQYQ